jgi:ComF family protein
VHLGAALVELWQTWLDAIFPPRCAGCNRLGYHFCPACRRAVRPLPAPLCESCGRPVAAGQVCCPDCRTARLPLAGVRSAGTFEGPLRTAIHRLKYRGRRGAARTLGHLLVAPAQSLGLPRAAPAPVVVPVPLHAQRQRERGYNQAALLARPLAERLGLAYEPALLRRVKATPSQVGLDRRRRRENVRGAFVATGSLAGRHVLLVDDLATTGSTLASAAQACLDAGAAAVYAVTLAREI